MITPPPPPPGTRKNAKIQKNVCWLGLGSFSEESGELLGRGLLSIGLLVMEVSGVWVKDQHQNVSDGGHMLISTVILLAMPPPKKRCGRVHIGDFASFLKYYVVMLTMVMEHVSSCMQQSWLAISYKL